MHGRGRGVYNLLLLYFSGLWLFLLPAASVQGLEDAGQIVISPKGAILRGIESNFRLKAQSVAIPESREEVVIHEAKFDPALEADFSARDRKTPTGFIFYEDGYDETDQIGGGGKIRKSFETGLQGEISLESYRSRDNFLADSLDPEYRGVITLNLIQPILRDFGVDINTTEINAAKNRVEMAFLTYTGAARSLAEQIEIVYFDLSRAQEVLKFQMESLRLAEELKTANEKKFENGTASITPVTEAKTAVTDRREQIIFAEQQLETASNRLKNLLEYRPGQHGLDKKLRALPMNPPTGSCPSFEEVLDTALSKRSDLKEMQIALENQNLMIAWLENQKLPRLDFVASAGINGLSGGDDPVNLFGHVQRSRHVGDYSEALSNMVDAEGRHWSAGLRMVYPIGNRAARSRYVQGKHQKRRMEYLLERLKGQIRMEVSNGVLGVEKSCGRVKETEKFIALARETLDQENQLLEEGLSTTFRILIQQEKLVAARIRHVNALADYYKSMAELYRSTGENLEKRGIKLEISDLVHSF
jgi:outer membrane protein TolC